jgi:hypothetical protein
MKPQTKRVLDLITRREGACMDSFLHHHIARYSARLHELREAGYLITEEACDRTDHRGHVSYSLVLAPPENLLEMIEVTA